MESFFFKTALNKIREGIEEFGIFPYVTYLLNRAFKKTGGKLSIEHFCLFAIPVPDKTSHNIPKFLKNSYKVRVLHKYDQELEHFDTSFSTLQYRFNQNAACLLAKKKDEPVGFMWLVQNRYPEDIVYLVLLCPKGSRGILMFSFLNNIVSHLLFALVWPEDLNPDGIKMMVILSV